MKATLHRALSVCVLAGCLALALALAAGVGPASAESSVVGPGESIQKAIYAAHPGDTIVVKGVHREDVVIRKDGIELRGIDAGNVPSGPTPVSGGVVVSKDPYSSKSPKPMNDSVTGNHFGRNKPDIFWDKSGSGNRFLGNYCDASVPKGLCG